MPPAYRLSRRALSDLHRILTHSTGNWGEARAERYVEDIYKVFGKIAKTPEIGLERRNRAYPFLMMAAEQHFVVYHVMSDTVLILTVQHQRRDIERLIKSMHKDLLLDIEAFRARYS